MEEMNIRLSDHQDEVKVNTKNHNLFFLLLIIILIVLVIVFVILFAISFSKKNSIKDKKNDLEKKVWELEEEKELLNKTVSKLGKEKENLEKTVSNLEREKEQLNKTISNLEVEKEQLKETVSDLEAEKEQLNKTVSDLEAEKEQLKETVSNLETEKEQLNKTVSDLETEKENLEKINAALTQENEDLKKKNFDWAMFGEKIENISYAENNIIKNSFGKEGKNYIEEIGEVNNNEDYISNDRNIYDLYIPYSATQKKDQYNRIILFIHGGNWFKGNKRDMDIYCRTYGSLGFITATIGYTLLSEEYENYSIFRIIDEITATTKNIKKQLEERGFDGEKLEMAISGYSAGGHLCLLYPYAFGKDSAIPIRFIINFSGVTTLDIDHFIKLANYNVTLDNIDSESIEQARKENKIVPLNTEYPGIPKSCIAMYLNLFLGRKGDEDIDEMYDFEKQEIKKTEIYNEIYKKANYALPLDYVNENTIPTICIYGGNDDDAGIGHYAVLKDKFDEYENGNLTLIYSRYAPHLPYELNTENGINKAREMIYSVLDFTEKYCQKD